MVTPSSIRPLDDDYAKLSILVGFFIGAADLGLGRPHFRRIIDPHVWELTWEKLTAWKAEAVAMGIPAQYLEPTQVQMAMLPRLIERGYELQAKVDAEREHDDI